MRIAVVTPYYDETESVLRACHDSVRGQTHAATHIMVADGHPQAWIDSSSAQHIVLPVSHRNYGDTPRAIASVSAITQKFDGIAYLDADNWYQPDHIESMVQLHRETGAAICSTRRSMHRIDGSLMGYCFSSDGEDFVDTNCLAVFREAFRLLPCWGLIPDWAHVLGDRMMWHLLRDSGLKRAHLPRFTVCYRDSYLPHYLHMGENPPEGARATNEILQAIGRWDKEGLPPFRKEFDVRRSSEIPSGRSDS
ncbi:glycosyltransferase family 2 protein [Pelagibius sp.]|uniref:glycosyltransferase family 2 protein n=1 Tax=Pelagibius sp. TaxID=1931238 RepID=UPI003BAE4EB0